MEKGTSRRSPVQNETVQVSILPHSPTVRDDLRVVVPGGVEIRQISWYRDGIQILEADSDVLPSHSFRKGEELSVNVTTEKGEATASKVIGNIPPDVIAVDFADPQIRSGVPIEVIPEGVDDDGDLLSFRFVWAVNGNIVANESGHSLPANYFQKGDRVLVQAFASDGEAEGSSFVGQEFVIPNSPPVFLTNPPMEFSSRDYVYEVQAEDPDGDPVAYRLEAGPPGMGMDRTGKISWSIDPSSAGEHQIRIVAEDTDGARAIQQYTLRISFQEG